MVSEVYSKDFLCGLGAGMANILVTYPITKLIFRQILDGINVRTATKQLVKEGPYFLYRGSLAPMIQKTISMSIMFGVYNYAKTACREYKYNQYLQQVCAGIISGTTEAFFMPFDRILVLLVHAPYYGKFKNMPHTIKVVQKEYGLREFYRGFSLMVIRNTASNCGFFIAKAEFYKYSNSPKSALSESLSNFFIGGFLGAFVATVFYPLKVVKVVIQRKLGGPFMPLSEAFLYVYKLNGGGIKNFYQGVVVNFYKSILSWGITVMTFEHLHHLL